MVAWHKADLENRMYCNLPGGKKISMPRYYKEKIYESWERKLAGSTQLNKIREREAKEIKEYGPNYHRDKNQAIIAAFKKQDLKYHSNQKL